MSNGQPFGMGGVTAVGGLLGGPVGVGAGALLDMGMQFVNQGASNKTQKYLARLAYDKALEQWNRANAYNSPEQQMVRLKNAGLNPNLVYGNGVTGNTTQAGSPQYNPPDLRYNVKLNALNTLQVYQDYTLKQRQIDAMEKEIESRDLQNRFALRTMNDRVLQEQYKRGLIDAQSFKTLTQGNDAYLKYGVNYKLAESGRLMQYSEAKIDALLQQIGIGKQTISKNAKTLELFDQEVKMARLRASMMGMEESFYKENLRVKQALQKQELEWNTKGNRWIRYGIDTGAGLIAPVGSIAKNFFGNKPQYPSYDSRNKSFSPNYYNNSYLENQFYTP